MVSAMLVSSRIRLWAKFTAVLWNLVPVGCHPATPISSTANAIPVRLRGDTLFGRILSSAGNAVGEARVQVFMRKPGAGDSLFATVLSQKDGTFRIGGLPLRSYHFAVRAIGYRPTDGEVRVSRSGSASLSVQLEPDVMRLEEIAPPERQDPSRPVEGVIRCSDLRGHLPRPLLIEAQSRRRPFPGATVVADSVGRFRLPYITVGEDWDVHVRTRDTQLASALVGGWPPFVDTLRIILPC